MTITRTVEDSIKREIHITKIALKNLKDKLRCLEQKHNMRTGTFVKRFSKGLLGDNEEYFLWYAYYEALKDWQRRQKELKDFLMR